MENELIEIRTLSAPKMIYDIPHHYIEFKYLNNNKIYTAEVIEFKGKLITGDVKGQDGKRCKIHTRTLSKVMDEIKEYAWEAINYKM